MTFVFKHPKFYRIPRDKSDQAISWRTHDGGVQRAPDPGQSDKQQAPSKVGSKASSLKQQATSVKHQAVRDD
jgi:hypothetical protein